MSIQGNINQSIYIGGLALQNSLEGYAQTRRRGKALQAEAEAAQISLDDIERTLRDIERGDKAPLSKIEKDDMNARIRKNVNTIYDAVTAADNPQLSKYINKDKFSPELVKRMNPILEQEGLPTMTGREGRSAQLKGIEGLMQRDPTKNLGGARERILAAKATELAQDNKRRYSSRFNKPELKEDMPDVTKINKFSPDLKINNWRKDVKNNTRRNVHDTVMNRAVAKHFEGNVPETKLMEKSGELQLKKIREDE